jgi:uncharacterized membrane protein
MIYILLAMLFYTCAIILGAVASRNANTNLVAAISNIISAIIPVSVIIPILNKKLFTNSKYGVVMSVLTGIAIALFTMALTKSYSTNKVAIVAPVVFGGAIFLSSLLSYFFFKEKISFIQGVGLALLGLGLIFIIYARSTGR